MGVESVMNHADFRLMSRRALDMLSTYKEHNLYLRGLIPQIGLQTTTVDDVISERYAGKSKYTLKKMLNLALDGITAFSVKPLFDLQPRRTLPHHRLLHQHLCRTGVSHRYHTGRGSQCSQDCRCDRCNQLHNKLSCLFLTHCIFNINYYLCTR